MTEDFLATIPATRMECRGDGMWFIDPDGTTRGPYPYAEYDEGPYSEDGDDD